MKRSPRSVPLSECPSTSPGATPGTGPSEDLEDLYENAPCGYFSVETNGSIFKINATLSRWLGFTPGQLVGTHVHRLLTGAGQIFYEMQFAPLMHLRGFVNEVALDLVMQNGNRLAVLVNAAERRDATGAHVFIRMTVFNATERRLYERGLVSAREMAEEARRGLEEQNTMARADLMNEQATSALREQFIAVLGHDLRNPLASIAAGLGLLERTPLNDRATKVVGMIHQSVSRMAGLIDDVLDFARGRLGDGLLLEWDTDCSVEVFLQQIVAELQVGAPDQLITSEFSIAHPVACDLRRIGQLASNLLANALTHGATDQPILIAAATVDGWFTLAVRNAGKPIPERTRESLFEPFARGDHRPNQHGLGLGLYISNEIAKAHGGTLTVVSKDEETCFTFRMPLRAVAS